MRSILGIGIRKEIKYCLSLIRDLATTEDESSSYVSKLKAAARDVRSILGIGIRKEIKYGL